MIEERTIPSGESRESIRASAEQRASTVLNDINLRTRDIGVQNRNKVSVSILAEALVATYIEGRGSAVIDAALREAAEARARELESAKSLIAQEAVTLKEVTMQSIGQFSAQSASAFIDGLVKPARAVMGKAVWWAIGLAVANAAIVAALVVLLLRK